MKPEALYTKSVSSFRVALSDLEQRATQYVEHLRLRCEELSADVDRLGAENKNQKIQIKQLQQELDLERKLREKDRKLQKVVEESYDIETRKIAKGMQGAEPLATVTTSGTKLSLVSKILLCLWQVGKPCTRNQIAFYTGMSPTSGSMGTAYADALDEGLVVQAGRGKGYELTEAGTKAISEAYGSAFPPAMPRGSEIFGAFCEREGGNVEVLAEALYALARLHGFDESFTREQIAQHASEATGRTVSSTSGSTGAAFARLVKLEVIKGRRGGYQLSEWMKDIVRPVTIGVRDTRTGREHKVEVK